VRDARPEGREECGPRRDRQLAGRSGTLIDTALRIAAAILVDTLAFIVWNLASRSPAQVFRDLVRGFRRPGTLVRGIVSFLVGVLLIVGSTSILVPLALPVHALVVLMTWTVVTGLLVEQIVGPDLYARLMPSRDR
jgi:hypothetical protein